MFGYYSYSRHHILSHLSCSLEKLDCVVAVALRLLCTHTKMQVK